MHRRRRGSPSAAGLHQRDAPAQHLERSLIAGRLRPADCARCAAIVSHASSGRRQPCADALSIASAITGGLARPLSSSTAAPICRASASGIACSADSAAASDAPAATIARCCGGRCGRSSAVARPARYAA